MEKKDIKTVLERLHRGEIGEQDEQVALYWLNQLHKDKELHFTDEALEGLSHRIWQRLEAGLPLSVPARHDEQAGEDKSSERSETPIIRPLKRWSRRLMAAATLAILFSGVWFYTRHQQVPGSQSLIVNDLAPGGHGATLTLANGQQIKLNAMPEGDLAGAAGVRISKLSDGELRYEVDATSAAGNQNGDAASGNSDALIFNTLSTARGETYRVHLPDGTQVWLNADSKLTFPLNLNGNTARVVKLEGEAYFEVAKRNTPESKNKEAIPFIVETAQQTLQVLGTHFNINAYKEHQAVTTTLLEGSVELFASAEGNRLSPSGKERIRLKPNQQSILNRDGIAVKTVNAQDAIGWKNGLFVFNDEPLQNIMDDVARWYNVEVVYMPEVAKDEKYYGSITRYDKVSNVMRALEETKGIHFKIEGRRVTLMK